MDGRKIYAVWKKQVKDTLKNKVILIQFVMFPLLTAVMQNTIDMQGMQDNFFVILFATMYIGMAPLTSMAAIISEEKECNTLRVLLMSNVKAGEYLLGTGGYVFMICTIGALFFRDHGKFQGRGTGRFCACHVCGNRALPASGSSDRGEEQRADGCHFHSSSCHDGALVSSHAGGLQ